MKNPQWRRWFWSLASVGLLAGCASLMSNKAIQPQRYDLGPAAEVPAAARPWNVVVEAQEELGARAMRYRLLYDQPTEVRFYTHSQWVDLPAGIVRKALETRLYWPEGVKADSCGLHLELLRFEQEFDAPGTSRGVLTVRAALRRNGVTIDERLWSHAAPAAFPNAAGGVAALSESLLNLVATLQNWRADRREACLSVP